MSGMMRKQVMAAAKEHDNMAVCLGQVGEGVSHWLLPIFFSFFNFLIFFLYLPSLFELRG